jgi:hypothetical protein
MNSQPPCTLIALIIGHSPWVSSPNIAGFHLTKIQSSFVIAKDHDADHDASLHARVRRLEDIMTELDGSDLQLHAVSCDEPTSLAEAQADQN